MTGTKITNKHSVILHKKKRYKRLYMDLTSVHCQILDGQ